jgi:Protein of unknown function (DUF4435)
VRDLRTGDADANQIRMRRSTFTGVFLLVEGSSDKFFYECFVDKLSCQISVISGKPSSKERVIAVLGILEKSNFLGVLGIVDADFDRLDSLSHNSPNLLLTDTHDLETMLINSPALDKVVRAFGSEEKIAKFGTNVRTVLVEAGISIGYLRWISQCDRLDLTFNGIKYSKFIKEQSLQIDELELIKEVKNKSQMLSLDNKDILQRIAEQKSNNHDCWQVCCGHDLVEILSLGLRKAIGTMKSSEIEPDSLERSLRLAYEEVYFRQTQLYSNIRQWESKNVSFQVLSSLGAELSSAS